MQTYFHYNIKKDRKRMGYGIALIVAPLFQASLLAMLMIFFSLGCVEEPDNIAMLSAVACGCILAAMLLSWLWYELYAHKIAANSRYTYFDILPKCLVFSRYEGSHPYNHGRAAIRTLYVIPLKTFSEAAVHANGKELVIKGNIRIYSMNSEMLGYHVGDGEMTFDHWWLDHGAYQTVSSVKIPHFFGSAKRLEKEVLAAKKRFDEAPVPKPYVFKEADFIRRRPKPRVLPEDFSYNRRW